MDNSEQPAPAGAQEISTPSAEKSRCCGDFDLSKLGQCRTCMLWSLVLTVVSWIVYIAVRRIHASAWISVPILIYGCLLSLLLLAHAVARVVKARRT
jgi:Cu/Ag efflux pump CusA